MARMGRGRRKLEMKKMENEKNLQVTFSKRRKGLFKKASELCTLCGADAAIIVSSPSGKVFSFGNPSVEEIADRFLTGQVRHRPGTLQVQGMNQELTMVTDQLELEKKLGEELSRRVMASQAEYRLDLNDIGQLEQLKASLEHLRILVANEAENRLVAHGLEKPVEELNDIGQIEQLKASLEQLRIRNESENQLVADQSVNLAASAAQFDQLETGSGSTSGFGQLGVPGNNVGFIEDPENNFGFIGGIENNFEFIGGPENNFGFIGGPENDFGFIGVSENNIGHTGDLYNNVGFTGGSENNVGFIGGSENNVGHTGDPYNNVGFTEGPENNVGLTGGPENNVGFCGGPQNNAGFNGEGYMPFNAWGPGYGGPGYGGPGYGGPGYGGPGYGGPGYGGTF